MLLTPEGKRLLDSPVSEFNVYGPYVYGWIDRGGGFFLLNTMSGNIATFKKWADLDVATDKLGAPRLTMAKSFTYWDIVGGYKQRSW